MSVQEGSQVGPYTILCRLGEGGMGEVWKARDKRLDRIVAIKFPKLQFSERFRREAQLVAALNHANICALYAVGPDYLVMGRQITRAADPGGELARVLEEIWR